MNNADTLINDAMTMIQNSTQKPSYDVYSTMQPGGSLQSNLWSVYLDSQQKYQKQSSSLNLL